MWWQHILSLITKLNKVFYIVLTTQRVSGVITTIMVYYAYIYSQISYGIFWRNLARNKHDFVIQGGKKKLLGLLN